MKSVNVEFITLYHGTTLLNGLNLVKYGWEPNRCATDLSNSKYLYLTSDYDDAMWYANEKSGNTIVEITNIPIDFLSPDPESEIGYNIENLLRRLIKNKKPSKFVLTQTLNNEHFNIFDK
jgi:hypothetical protein